MKDADLFQLTLGLTPPWEVVSCALDLQRQRLDIKLGFPRGSMFACPECGQMGLKAPDAVEKTWRRLNFFQHEACLSAKVPRVRCNKRGVKLLSVLFRGLDQEAASRCCSSPWSRPSAAYVGEHDARLRRILHHCVDQARKLQAGLLGTWRLPGTCRGSPGDMSQAFIGGIREHFTKAQVAFDKFHIMKIVSEAVVRNSPKVVVPGSQILRISRLAKPNVSKNSACPNST